MLSGRITGWMRITRVNHWTERQKEAKCLRVVHGHADGVRGQAQGVRADVEPLIVAVTPMRPISRRMRAGPVASVLPSRAASAVLLWT